MSLWDLSALPNDNNNNKNVNKINAKSNENKIQTQKASKNNDLNRKTPNKRPSLRTLVMKTKPKYTKKKRKKKNAYFNNTTLNKQTKILFQNGQQKWNERRF